jgi:hypothetical protein
MLARLKSIFWKVDSLPVAANQSAKATTEAAPLNCYGLAQDELRQAVLDHCRQLLSHPRNLRLVFALMRQFDIKVKELQNEARDLFARLIRQAVEQAKGEPSGQARER